MPIEHCRNAVVIICDQLQRQVLGTYGGHVPTPNLNSLAARSTVFDEFYCATPLCVPTRPSMMTGNWPHTHGSTCFGQGYDTVRGDQVLLIDYLMDRGYHVGHEGVWHINRNPEDDRTAEYAHHKACPFPYRQHVEMLVAQGGRDGDQRGACQTPTDSGEPYDWALSLPVPAVWTRPADEHPDAVIASNIASFIREAPDDAPVAAWCSLGGPHPPILVPEPYHGMFKPGDVIPPASYHEDPSTLPGPVRDAPGAQGVRDWSWDQWARGIAAYWGFVAFLDHCIGQVLRAIQDSGRADETVVIATADHGEMLSAHRMYQKGVLYDESCHIPFMIAVPGLPPGRTGDFGSHVDIPSTITELLGVPPLSGTQGHSLLPGIESGGPAGRDAAFVEFNGYLDGGVHTRGVVTREWKYIYHHGDRDQLFDRERDPHEMNDLSRDPAAQEVRARLRERLAAWMADTGDFLSPAWPA